MSCTKDMLSVLMDGIKDTDMILWYSKDADDNGSSEWSNWFKTKARKRLDMLESDYSDVMNAIDIDAKIQNGDEIASALKEHLDCEIDKLRTKIR